MTAAKGRSKRRRPNAVNGSNGCVPGTHWQCGAGWLDQNGGSSRLEYYSVGCESVLLFVFTTQPDNFFLLAILAGFFYVSTQASIIGGIGLSS